MVTSDVRRSRPQAEKPWLPHFYLGHGIGTSAAEMPMIGTDLGQDWDDGFVFPAGMLLVFEPVVWEDGTGAIEVRRSSLSPRAAGCR